MIEPGMTLAEAFNAAFALLRTSPLISVDAGTTLAELERHITSGSLPAERLLTSTALLLARSNSPARRTRNEMTYLRADRRAEAETTYTTRTADETRSLSADQVHKAVVSANATLELFHDVSQANNAPIFTLLGLRNLSGFVGQVFASELCALNPDLFLANPNQDGYPDLLATTPEGLNYINEREGKGQTSDKSYWSPYPFGGVEVKATCGDTPPAKEMTKPKIGEARLRILEGATWKAHHQETNNLLGIYWDFVDGLPTVLAAFYRNDLTVADWGETIVPREGGGNVTSVSIMRKGAANNIVGVKKMGRGWLVLPFDAELRSLLCQQKVFAISQSDISAACSDVDRPATATVPFA